MDDSIKQSIQSNTREVFEKMMNIAIEVKESTGSNTFEAAEITSMVDIHDREGIRGYMGLNVSHAIAEKMEQGMLGEEKGGNGGACEDTVNEVLNMIAGRSKSLLIRKYPGAEFSLPFIVPPAGLPEGLAALQCERMYLPFMFGNDVFFLEVCM